MTWSSYESPFDLLTLAGSETGLREVHFPGRATALDPADRDRDSLRDVVNQMDEYFAGKRERFEVALDLSGTVFQTRVRRALQKLPCGRVTTYGHLARELGVDDSRTPVTLGYLYVASQCGAPAG
jgi:methylated-DNA-[protein]-cysteine S-methyltransferase